MTIDKRKPVDISPAVSGTTYEQDLEAHNTVTQQTNNIFYDNVTIFDPRMLYIIQSIVSRKNNKRKKVAGKKDYADPIDNIIQYGLENPFSPQAQVIENFLENSNKR